MPPRLRQRSLTRFVDHLVHRHHGDTHSALVEAKDLSRMSEYGLTWWNTVTSQLAYRYACEYLTLRRRHARP